MAAPGDGWEKGSAVAKRRRISLGWLGIAAFLLLFLLVPLFWHDPYLLHIFVLAFHFAFLGTAWSLVSMAGQLSLGHAALMGIGGYTSTLLFMELGVSPWIGMWAGAMGCAIIGVVIGFPAFRLRGPYFALTSIAFAEILRIYVENTEVGPFGIPLRAAMGLLVPLRGQAPAVFQFDSKEPYYYIALGMMCIAVGLSYLINRSRIGFYLTAIRSDQDAAEALGINSTKYKLMAMAISCALTALGGTFYAQYFRYINPERAMGLGMSIEIALVGVVGGWQTVLGPMIGSILLTPTGELVRAYLGGTYAGLHLLLYGLLLMGVILFLPNGLNDPLLRAFRRLEARVWGRAGEAGGVAPPTRPQEKQPQQGERG
jgi:branched-chain amino acid transport system permease protein